MNIKAAHFIDSCFDQSQQKFFQEETANKTKDVVTSFFFYSPDGDIFCIDRIVLFEFTKELKKIFSNLKVDQHQLSTEDEVPDADLMPFEKILKSILTIHLLFQSGQVGGLSNYPESSSTFSMQRCL